MKHLKSYNESIDNVNGYKSIDIDEVIKSKKNAIFFDSKSINIIKKQSFIGKSYNEKHGVGKYQISQTLNLSGEMPPDEQHKGLVRDSTLYIHQLSDDWYIVEYITRYQSRRFWNAPKDSTEYYLCDQIEGLLELLRNKNIIK